jgi:hypothetical protein
LVPDEEDSCMRQQTGKPASQTCVQHIPERAALYNPPREAGRQGDRERREAGYLDINWSISVTPTEYNVVDDERVGVKTQAMDADPGRWVY